MEWLNVAILKLTAEEEAARAESARLDAEERAAKEAARLADERWTIIRGALSTLEDLRRTVYSAEDQT